MDTQQMKLLVGSYAQAEAPGLYLCEFDLQTAQLAIIGQFRGIENPSHLCANGDLVHVLSETGGEYSSVTSFRLRGETTLAKIGQVAYRGIGACYISTDQANRHVFVAHYESGDLLVFPVLANGSLGQPKQRLTFSGRGPDEERQEKPHLHAVAVSPGNGLLYCTDLGADKIYRYFYDPANEQPLRPAVPSYVALPPGSGPRHLAWSSSRAVVYLLTEMSAELFAFKEDSMACWFQNMALSAGRAGKAEAASLVLSPDEQYLYASNRGDFNEITVFSINKDGLLTRVQVISAHGIEPAYLAIDPSGKFLLVANKKSHAINVFAIDQFSGQLRFTGQQLAVNSPNCQVFLTGFDQSNLQTKQRGQTTLRGSGYSYNEKEEPTAVAVPENDTTETGVKMPDLGPPWYP